MSVSKNPRRPGTYEVRWRQGGRRHSRSFDRKGDAAAFQLEVRRRKQLGALAPSVIQSKRTLAEFVREEWWPGHAIPNLDPDTRRRYLEVWGGYLLPTLGEHELREITPMLVEDLRDQLVRRGLGAASVRKALLLLSAILRRAVVRGLIPSNPVAVVDKPKTPPLAPRRPLAPATVERIRAQLRPRDAALVSLLAYGGLRPGEATTARWADLAERSLYVRPQKTSRERYVRLLSPVVQDLAEWRLQSGRPADRALIFACEQVPQSRRRATVEWQRHDWQNWTKRTYQPAAIAAGVEGDLRPYRLRGSFVSLLPWSGMDLVEVADQAGHSVATLAKALRRRHRRVARPAPRSG
jgi:integrase